MNKKAENLSIGNIIMIAVVAIVGIIILTICAQNISHVTDTFDVVNESTSSVNGTTLANIVQFQGKRVSSVVVYNGTDDVIMGSGNYTIYQNQVIDGTETAGINVSADRIYQPQNWNISYTTQPTTYDTNAGGRAVAALVVVFFAIAIAIIMLIPTLRDKILESIGR